MNSTRKAKMRLSARRYYERNVEKVHRSARIWRAKNRAMLIDMLGGRCAHCGYDKDRRALEIDHVVPICGVRTVGRNTEIDRRVKYRDLTNVQVLCANCHAIKTYEEKTSGAYRKDNPPDVTDDHQATFLFSDA